VNWDERIDRNFYKQQNEVYAKIRPTLLSNTLLVPSKTIRDHIYHLATNDFNGIRNQVEGFHRTNTRTSRKKDIQKRKNFRLNSFSCRSTISFDSCGFTRSSTNVYNRHPSSQQSRNQSSLYTNRR